MNIEQIYDTKGVYFFAKEVGKMYARFEKTIEADKDFTLNDDEMAELFDELLIMFLKNQMSDYEFNRVTTK